jgi:hypothetical protein
MSPLLVILSALVPVFGAILTGFVVRRVGWLTESADKTLIALTVRLLMPCLIVRAVTTGDWFDSPRDLLLPPAVGAGLSVMGFIVCAIFTTLLGRRVGLHTPAEHGTFILCAGLFNYGYTPIPLVRELFPSDTATLATLLIHNVGVDTAMWTIGLLLLAGRLQPRWWAGLLNPVVLAIAVAVTLKLGVPALLGEALTVRAVSATRPLAALLSLLADAAIPLSLLLTGATIADVWRQADFRRGLPATAAACVLRLGVLPVLFLLVAALPLGLPLGRVVLVQAAMPAAIFPIVLARHYGGDQGIAVRVVIATQLLSIVTSPLWLWIGGVAGR